MCICTNIAYVTFLLTVNESFTIVLMSHIPYLLTHLHHIFVIIMQC